MMEGIVDVFADSEIGNVFSSDSLNAIANL
jgi:hypothetical protein